MLGGKPGERPLPMLAALLLLLGAMAGCIGSDGTEETPDPNDQPDPNAGPGGTGELEELSYSFDGQATAGLGLMATGSYFWTLSDVPSYEVDVPETLAGGNLSFSWDALVSQGGVMLMTYEDGEILHRFQADSSPFETELEPDDERILGATSISIVPEWEPASAHAMVTWDIELDLLHPAEGDGAGEGA